MYLSQDQHMLNMLYDVTVLEPSMSFHYDHVTNDIILDPTPRFPSIENKSGKKLNKIHYLQF